MSWPKSIERWRRFALWECKDVPPDLVLAIIQNESGGVPGIVGRVPIATPGPVPTLGGGFRQVDRALGLMQAIPATIEGYNARQADQVRRATYEDMTGTDDRAARLQIAVGCYYLAAVNHFLNKNFPEAAPDPHLAKANPDQVRLVLTGYAVGAGATGRKLQTLAQAGKPANFASLKINFPNWGKKASGEWSNRPLYYAQKVGARYLANKSSSYTGGKAGHLAERAKDALSGGGWVFLAAAGFYGGWKLYGLQKKAKK